MVITTTGRQWAIQKLAARDLSGTTNDLWTSQIAYYIESISVGDGTTSPTVLDTDLSGTNKTRRSLVTEADSSVSENNGSLLLSVTYPTTEANFVWNEIGVWIYNGSTRKLLLRELLENPGPAKANTHTRIASVSLSRL